MPATVFFERSEEDPQGLRTWAPPCTSHSEEMPAAHGESFSHLRSSDQERRASLALSSDNSDVESAAVEPRKSLSIPIVSSEIEVVRSSSDESATKSSGEALHSIRRKSHSSTEQLALTYDENTVLIRGRSRSSAGTIGNGRRSFGPCTTNEQNGEIDIAELDLDPGNRRLSLESGDTGDTHDNLATDIIDTSFEASQTYTPSSPQVRFAHSPSPHPRNAVRAITADNFGSDTLSGDESDSAEGGNTLSEDSSVNTAVLPIGKWRCCECQRGHEIYRFDTSDHLISALSCLCKHRSCRCCTFHGDIKRFAPIDDVAGLAIIPVTGDPDKNNRFGVVCRTCGLSWRTESVEKSKSHSHLRRGFLSLPKKSNSVRKLRHSRSMVHLSIFSEQHSHGSRLAATSSTARSVCNLRAAFNLQAQDTRSEEQAQGVEVRFYGIECTCGTVTDSSSLCFQLVNIPEVVESSTISRAVKAEATKAEATKAEATKAEATKAEVTRTAMSPLTPELQMKGYGTPTIRLRGISHPNPLRSNPV